MTSFFSLPEENPRPLDRGPPPLLGKEAQAALKQCAAELEALDEQQNKSLIDLEKLLHPLIAEHMKRGKEYKTKCLEKIQALKDLYPEAERFLWEHEEMTPWLMTPRGRSGWGKRIIDWSYANIVVGGLLISWSPFYDAQFSKGIHEKIKDERPDGPFRMMVIGRFPRMGSSGSNVDDFEDHDRTTYAPAARTLAFPVINNSGIEIPVSRPHISSAAAAAAPRLIAEPPASAANPPAAEDHLDNASDAEDGVAELTVEGPFGRGDFGDYSARVRPKMELCLSSECRGSYNNYRRRMVAKRCREFGLEPVKRNWTIKMEDIHYSSYIFEREVTWIEKGETRMAIGLFILDCPKCNWTDLSRTYLPHEKEALAHLRTCGVPTAGLKDDQDVFTTYSTIITPNNKQEAVTRMWAREHNMSLFNFVFGPKDPKFPHDEVALKRRGDEDEDAILPGERLLMAQQRKANERQSPSPVLPECRQTHQEKEENVTISQSAPSTRLNQRVAKKAGPLKRSSQKSRMVIDNESDDDILSPPNRLRQEPRGGASNGRLLRRHLPGPSQMDQQNEENFTTYQTAPSNRLDQGPSENEGPTKRSQKRRRDDDMDDESDFDIPGPSKRPRQESHSQDRAFNARSSRQTLPSSRQTRSQRVTRFTAQNSAATELDQGPENKAVQAARSQKRRRDAAPDSDADSEDHEQDEDYVPRPKPSKRQKVSQDENGEETNRGSRSKKGKSVSRPRKRVSFAEPPVSPTHSNQNRPISPQKSILKGKGSTHDPK